LKLGSTGKQRRLNRLFHSDGKAVIVPVDDGFTEGPIGGLKDIDALIESLCAGGIDGVLGFRGILSRIADSIPLTTGMIFNLAGSTSLGIPNDKRIVTSVESALRQGADAVAVHVNLGSMLEPQMLEMMGRVVDECELYEMPLLGIIYPRGGNITDENRALAIQHAARVGAEVGCDVVKTFYTGDKDSFSRVIEGCPIPVLAAGGPVKGLIEYFEDVENAMAAGAAGVVAGRNVFHRKDSAGIVRHLNYLVHGGNRPLEPSGDLFEGVTIST